MIARILGVDAKTLRKYYRDELDLASAKANAQIGGALYNKALGGDTASIIFWMKTRAGWSEKALLELMGEGGGPVLLEQTTRDADEFTRRMAGLATAVDATRDAETDAGNEGGS